MAQARQHHDRLKGEATKAFITGKFSPEVMDYLKSHNVATLVQSLPKMVSAVVLSPKILELDEAKLCGLFNALPKHVERVEFDFENYFGPADRHISAAEMKEKENRFIGLMAHTGYARDVKHFCLNWNFTLKPMSFLNDRLLSRSLPKQLNTFVLKGPGVELVTDAEMQTFKNKKLGHETSLTVGEPLRLHVRA